MKTQSAAAQRKRVSRRAIVESAALHLRRHGPTRASLKAITSDAGLTVGGFYNHFDSKSELLSHAFREAMHERRRALSEVLTNEAGTDRLAAWLAHYVSARHRDDAAHGCPIAATASEVTRESSELQGMALREIETSLRVMAAWVNPTAPEAGIAVAARTLAMAVGALQLARLTAGSPELSDAILAAANQGVPQ
jgi:AcrR family transcriptional regulator